MKLACTSLFNSCDSAIPHITICVVNGKVWEQSQFKQQTNQKNGNTIAMRETVPPSKLWCVTAYYSNFFMTDYAVLGNIYPLWDLLLLDTIIYTPKVGLPTVLILIWMYTWYFCVTRLVAYIIRLLIQIEQWAFKNCLKKTVSEPSFSHDSDVYL